MMLWRDIQRSPSLELCHSSAVDGEIQDDSLGGKHVQPWPCASHDFVVADSASVASVENIHH